MDFVIGLVVLGLPVMAYLLLFTERPGASAFPPHPSREGEARPWEVEAERAERRRLNTIIEEEMTRRAA